MRVKIAKWGNSLAVRLPKDVAREMKLAPGMTLRLDADPRKLTLSKADAWPAFPTLAEMVADMKAKGGADAEPRLAVWGPDVGEEVLPDDDYARGILTPETLGKGKRGS